MKIIKGDLIKLAEEGKFDVIIQGCNCFHTMGGGIAKQLANRYPIVEETDRQSEFGDRTKLGTSTQVIVKSLTTNHLFMVKNAYTQYYWSRGEDVFEYDAFQRFLNYTAELIIHSYSPREGFVTPTKRPHYGFPQIGAGLAGGDWSRISKMIEKFSEDVSDYADVTVVEYKP
jgi:O-acetyl-ADP-ribose deacetylase (regulator of RNase III)